MIVNKVDKGGNVILKKGKAYCQFCEEFSMVMINYGFIEFVKMDII